MMRLCALNKNRDNVSAASSCACLRICISAHTQPKKCIFYDVCSHSERCHKEIIRALNLWRCYFFFAFFLFVTFRGVLDRFYLRFVELIVFEGTEDKFVIISSTVLSLKLTPP